MSSVPVAAGTADTLVSHTGVPLTRPTTFRFTLDVNVEQHQRLLAHAGASRLTFNHHLERVRANLEQRAAERSYGIPEADLTPVLSWSKGQLHQRDERLEGRPSGLCARGGPRRRHRRPWSAVAW
ncbi:helix-turn-helix domain-containing protein [Nocardioides pakistanensis]